MASHSSIKEEYEKRKLAEKQAHSIVEKLIEEKVQKDQFLSWLKLITGQHYTDAVEERSLSDLCGYCLCKNKLKEIPTQQYKINKNKVFDITERKKFCSNRCYAISSNILEQISSTPLWLRNHDLMPDITIPNIDKSTVKSAGGKEIHLTHIISRKEVDSLDSKDTEDGSVLDVKSSSNIPNPTTYTQHKERIKSPHKSQKLVDENPKRTLNIADEVFNILQQWMTVSTQEYLGIIEAANQGVADATEILERENKLQQQLDKLILGGSSHEEPSKPVPDYKILKDEVDHFEDRVSSFYKGSLHVKERQHRKIKQDSTSGTEDKIGPALPTVDSKNQNIIRHKIVLERVKRIIDDLTPPLPNVTQECRQLLKTFRFTNTNVMLSVELWPVMTFAILNLLSIKNQHLRKCLQSPTIMKLSEILLKSCNLTQISMEEKVQTIAKNMK
ncbi:putative RNA polymerase II subunit B1 CTD phosphatase rpap2 [Styela clava]